MDSYKKYKIDGSVLKMPESIKQRTEQYLEKSCKLLEFFKSNFELSNGDYIKIGDIFDKFKSTEFYINSPYYIRKKYTKQMFLEYFTTNIFTKKYYKDRHNNIRNVLLNWKTINTVDNY
jgi:hypothetical protein